MGFDVQPSTSIDDHWFFSREREIEYISSWLSNPDSPSALVSVHGIGGIGKSTLLRRAVHLSQKANVISIWVDGKSLLPVPRTFLDYLSFVLAQTYALPLKPNGSTLDEVFSALSGRRFTLIIDNCDQLGLLEGWFRETFLRFVLRQQSLVFIASRHPLLLSWQTDAQLKSKIVTLALKPWTPSEVAQYARLHGLVEQNQVQSILVQTGGLPLAVGLAMDGWLQRQDGNESAGPSWFANLHRINANLLDETVSPRLRKWLDAISILPETPWEILDSIVGEPLSDEMFRELSKLSIVVASPTGLSLHDSVRRLIAQELKAKDELRYARLRKSVVQTAIAQYANGDTAIRYRLAAQLLELYKDSLSQFGPYDFEKMPVTAESRPINERDLNSLYSFAVDLPQLSAQSINHLLNSLSKNCPDCIRVIRSVDGEPLAFWICLWIYNETIHLLENFAPNLVCSLSKRELAQYSSLPREEADTYAALAFGIHPHHPVYAPPQLTAAIMYDSLPLTATGTRAYFPVTEITLLPFLLSLGFRPQRMTRQDGYAIYSIDGRKLDLPNWYRQCFAQIEEPAHDPKHRGKLPGVAELIEIMKRIEDVEYLHHSALARMLQIDGPELRHWIIDLLTTPLIPDSNRINANSRTLLKERYLTGPVTIKEMYNRHHLSRASLYRRLNEALGELYQALQTRRSAQQPEMDRRAETETDS